MNCSRCGEEVRWGWRNGRQAHWHRLDVDHLPILGHQTTLAEKAWDESELDIPRERFVPTKDGWPLLFTIETYTTRQHDLDRYRKNKKFRDAEEAEQDDAEIVPLPEPEIRSHPIDPSEFAPRSGIRQVINLVAKEGWDLRRLTHSRGPYMGSRGEMLSISDTVVLGARGQVLLDGSVPIAVASWRDNGFDFAWIGVIRNSVLSPHPVNATDLKKWIKGTYDLPDAVQQESRGLVPQP